MSGHTSLYSIVSGCKARTVRAGNYHVLGIIEMSQIPTFEIATVKPAPTGANYIARVAFAYRPSDMYPLRITHSVEKADGYRNYTDAEIDGATRVRVNSAFLRKSQKGDLYVQVNGLDLPWDLSKAVAEAAYQQLETVAE